MEQLNIAEEQKTEARIGEVAIYNPDDSIKLEVRLEQDNVWLDRTQIAILFGRDKTTIEKHINTALKEELRDVPTAAKFAALQKEGNRWVNRYKEYFNLDMILSIGYRVHSSRGIAFRRWANMVLKDYLIRGHVICGKTESYYEEDPNSPIPSHNYDRMFSKMAVRMESRPGRLPRQAGDGRAFRRSSRQMESHVRVP